MVVRCWYPGCGWCIPPRTCWWQTRTTTPPSSCPPTPHLSTGQSVTVSSVWGNHASLQLPAHSPPLYRSVSHSILSVRQPRLPPVARPLPASLQVSVWLDRLAVNSKVATVLGSIPASFDTVESEGRQMKQCWITYLHKKKKSKNPSLWVTIPCKKFERY